MNSIHPLTFLILLTLGFSSNQENRLIHKTESNSSEPIQSEFDFSIYNGRIHNYNTGIGTEEFLKQISTTFEVRMDSAADCIDCVSYSPIYYIEQNGFVLFSAEPDWDNPDKIFRFVVRNSRFKTGLEIGVGSTYKELKEKYEIVEIDISGEEGAHAIVKNFKGSFGLELTDSDDWWNLNKDTYPDESRITEIIIL